MHNKTETIVLLPGEPGRPTMARVDCSACGAFAVVLADQADRWHTAHTCDVVEQVLEQADTILALQLEREAAHADCSRDRIDCDHKVIDDQIATERLALAELIHGARVGGGQR